MVERRKKRRIACRLKTIVNKTLPDRRAVVMEFVTTNISAGGVFIAAEDLSLFDLGEELSIVVVDAEDRFYEGLARVVRSARFFTADNKISQSGYGLLFIDPPPESLFRIDRHVDKHDPIIL